MTNGHYSNSLNTAKLATNLSITLELLNKLPVILELIGSTSRHVLTP